MRKKNLLSMLLFSAISISHALGAITQADMNSQVKSDSAPQLSENNQKKMGVQSNAIDSSKEIKMVPKVDLPKPTPSALEYFHPGILIFKEDQWEGSDHLLNLSKNIGVHVAIIKPEGETLSFNAEELQSEVESIFRSAGIIPTTLAFKTQSPLPAFEIEVLVYPVDKGYVASCDGRLFESVTLSRFKLDEGMAFSAITWEKSSLIVGPSAKFSEQLNSTVKDIAKSFAERFKGFEKLNKN